MLAKMEELRTTLYKDPWFPEAEYYDTKYEGVSWNCEKKLMKMSRKAYKLRGLSADVVAQGVSSQVTAPWDMSDCFAYSAEPEFCNSLPDCYHARRVCHSIRACTDKLSGQWDILCDKNEPAVLSKICLGEMAGEPFEQHPKCPASPDAAGLPCDASMEAVVCEYGEKCCCGKCNAAEVLGCQQATWTYQKAFCSVDDCDLCSTIKRRKHCHLDVNCKWSRVERSCLGKDCTYAKRKVPTAWPLV
eukprot:TRINITY_DN5083_c0_g1_i1.p1 TRINITY_DN5083_c0_g1~~TRINITY_DN5083_c0_g1_i1.p1  ORF type:complete len:245 (-),score=32.93 TRINITY_DN5083_c0_g1_i1:27-761(-)